MNWYGRCSRSIFLIFVITGISIWNAHGQRPVFEQSIFFDTDIHDLKEEQIAHIKSMLVDVIPDSIYNIRVLGYADYRGSVEYNLALSSRRTQSVRKIIEEFFPAKVHRIESRGMGELPEKMNVPLRRDRKVKLEIYYYRPKNMGHLRRGEVGPMDEIVVENLEFKPGRHFLRLKSVPILKELKEVLLQHPHINLEIAGHVCCVGDFNKDGFDHDTKTHNLSTTRALNVYEYLVRNGVDSSRMVYKGYGYSEPLFHPEKTESEKNQNRRVEIRILSVDPSSK